MRPSQVSIFASGHFLFFLLILKKLYAGSSVVTPYKIAVWPAGRDEVHAYVKLAVAGKKRHYFVDPDDYSKQTTQQNRIQRPNLSLEIARNGKGPWAGRTAVFRPGMGRKKRCNAMQCGELESMVWPNQTHLSYGTTPLATVVLPRPGSANYTCGIHGRAPASSCSQARGTCRLQLAVSTYVSACEDAVWFSSRCFPNQLARWPALIARITSFLFNSLKKLHWQKRCIL